MLPLDVEEVRHSDGREKQEYEINAGKRLRREHWQMKVIVTADDRVSHEPYVQPLTGQRMHYVLVAKPDSPPELFEWGGDVGTGWRHPLGPVCQRRYFEHRIATEAPLSAAHTTFVTRVEVWERSKGGRSCTTIAGSPIRLSAQRMWPW